MDEPRGDPDPTEFTVGARRYGECARCGRVVWLNKPIIGALHRCRLRRPSDPWDDEDGWDQMRGL